VFAGVRPEGKAEVIGRLQAEGQAAVFVGDGVTLVSGDPLGVVDAIALARATMTVIRANLAWAFGYNLMADQAEGPRRAGSHGQC
jgi:P-type Cu+ transporter